RNVLAGSGRLPIVFCPFSRWIPHDGETARHGRQLFAGQSFQLFEPSGESDSRGGGKGRTPDHVCPGTGRGGGGDLSRSSAAGGGRAGGLVKSRRCPADIYYAA